ncbi:hypothetical protein JOE26_004094 [Rhodococcus coprophilus]|jgi:hypothetical protein|nr:hypothetical protein [Rhodococcus coprophilus]
MTGVSWLSDRRSPPAFRLMGRGRVEGRFPITVAGPRRFRTGFLFRHHLTGAFWGGELKCKQTFY